MNSLRIISGSAGGRKLKMVPGDDTRPITDRVKQALFNIIGSDIASAKLLDLFAGTGSVGIEALSRGAEYVRFIDRSKDAVDTVQANLATTGLGESADVLSYDAFALLSQHPNTAFDYVYVAPPQYHEMWSQALLALDAKPDWLVEDGWIIVQINPKEYEAVTLKNFSEFDQRKYSNTMLIFYEREPQENE
ncbi:MAG: 16S rRNA (guanine(966)-N(2))-methyltransferase RsmD [Chloroflexota bacterium]